MEEPPAFSVCLGLQAACPGVGVAVGGAAAEGFAQSSVFVVGVLADDGVSPFCVLRAAVDGAAVYVGVDVFGAAVSVRMGAQAALSVVAVGFAAAVAVGNSCDKAHGGTGTVPRLYPVAAVTNGSILYCCSRLIRSIEHCRFLCSRFRIFRHTGWLLSDWVCQGALCPVFSSAWLDGSLKSCTGTQKQ